MQFSPRQLEILRLIGEWPDAAPPRPSTLAQKLGFADESGVRVHLKKFEAAGLLRRLDAGRGVPKALELTVRGRTLAQLPQGGAREIEAPRHFGTPAIPARCGFKTIDGAGECGMLAMSHLFPKWRGDDLDHALIAESDSMQAPEGRAHPESIFEGDIVHGREGEDTGAHARVYVEYKLPSGQNDCALKIMEKRGKRVLLKSLNPAYPPVEVAARDIQRCYLVLDVRGLQRGDSK